jgi:hypothetical protein
MPRAAEQSTRTYIVRGVNPIMPRSAHTVKYYNLRPRRHECYVHSSTNNAQRYARQYCSTGRQTSLNATICQNAFYVAFSPSPVFPDCHVRLAVTRQSRHVAGEEFVQR